MFRSVRNNRFARFFWIILDICLAVEWIWNAVEHFGMGSINCGAMFAIFAIWCLSDVFVK